MVYYNVMVFDGKKDGADVWRRFCLVYEKEQAETIVENLKRAGAKARIEERKMKNAPDL